MLNRVLATSAILAFALLLTSAAAIAEIVDESAYEILGIEKPVTGKFGFSFANANTPHERAEEEPKGEDDDKSDDDCEGDGCDKKDSKKPKIKPFEEVVTDKAVSSEGVFTTHLVENKLYLEIPEEQLGRLFLWQTKIAGVEAGEGVISQDTARHYVYFERYGDVVLMRSRVFKSIYDEGTNEEDAIRASNLDTILTGFNVVAFRDEEIPVIDITGAVSGALVEVKHVTGAQEARTGGYRAQQNTVQILNAKAFERNIEIRVLGKFVGPKGSVTSDVRHSILALPDVPMKPRHLNSRVGYFAWTFTDHNTPFNRMKPVEYITRWRLEKQNPDAEVSEPKEPITWYVDRAMPEKYVQAVIDGIEFWQPAFESAGFRNAIVAKRAPTIEEDPDWDPEDSRYSVVRWVPSNAANAQGPRVADPRSGEILEADVRIFSNIVRLLETWYFTQASGTDLRARSLPLADDVMAKLVRYVVAHEVGHSLGLHHNFIASNAYTTEELRDPDFVRQFGLAASVMDYARFNYVMQPEDGVSPIEVPAGPYDHFAIEWGYREFPGDLTVEEETRLLNDIADRQLSDKRLRWDANFDKGARRDPRSRMEDLGDDAIKASRMGLQNLERVFGHLIDSANYEDGEKYAELSSLYSIALGQYGTEMDHVVAYIGAAQFRNELVQGHSETNLYHGFPLEKQKQALDFLAQHLFTVPAFLIEPKIIERAGYDARDILITSPGKRAIKRLYSSDVVDLQFKLASFGLEHYPPIELVDDLNKVVFAELDNRDQGVDDFRRLFQTTAVEAMILGVGTSEASTPWLKPPTNDYKALMRATLLELHEKLEKASDRRGKSVSGMHFAHLATMIEDALDLD